jgi:transcriptional regulator with XRE-family HTH domain
MSDPDQPRRQQTADVVSYWMRRRGMTRQVFADRLGKSVSWVDKIRNGNRQLDRVSILRQIAAALDADLLAPEEVRCRRMTRQLVNELVGSYPRGSRPTAAIVTLARALGVPA